MKPIYRRLTIFAVAVVVIAGGYFGFRFLAASERLVPQEFSEARSEGAVISERIVASSNDIALLVAGLGSATSTPAQVSSTISAVVDKATKVRAEAIGLAITLEAMTKAVEDIRIPQAQQAAVQSISHRLDLVERLIAYTDEIDELAAALRLRLQGGRPDSEDIADLIEDINDEVKAVNNSSRLADEAMTRFDELVR